MVKRIQGKRRNIDVWIWKRNASQGIKKQMREETILRNKNEKNKFVKWVECLLLQQLSKRHDNKQQENKKFEIEYDFITKVIIRLAGYAIIMFMPVQKQNSSVCNFTNTER